MKEISDRTRKTKSNEERKREEEEGKRDRR